jgi:hypothetical protein
LGHRAKICGGPICFEKTVSTRLLLSIPFFLQPFNEQRLGKTARRPPFDLNLVSINQRNATCAHQPKQQDIKVSKRAEQISEGFVQRLGLGSTARVSLMKILGTVFKTKMVASQTMLAEKSVLSPAALVLFVKSDSWGQHGLFKCCVAWRSHDPSHGKSRQCGHEAIAHGAIIVSPLLSLP